MERTLTWFARWRADWSKNQQSAITDKTLARHIKTHIAACFDPAAIERIRENWAVQAGQ